MSSWRQTEKEILIEIELKEKGLYFEVGPIRWPARGHESSGGTLSLAEFNARPKWFEEFPGLWERIQKDLKYMGRLE